MVPPSFTHVLQHEPRCTGNCLHEPAYGGQPAEFYFRAMHDFFSQLRVLFHSALIRAFHQLPALCMSRRTVTRPINAFRYLAVGTAACPCPRRYGKVHLQNKGQTKKPFILRRGVALCPPKGRRALALVLPPSFVVLSREQPR